MHHTWIDSASPCCRFDCSGQDSTLFFASVKFPVNPAFEPCERPLNRPYLKKQELIYFPMWFFTDMNFKVVILTSSASSYLGENAVRSFWREGLGRWFSWWSGCYESLRTWIWTPRTHVKFRVVVSICNPSASMSRWEWQAGKSPEVWGWSNLAYIV